MVEYLIRSCSRQYTSNVSSRLWWDGCVCVCLCVAQVVDPAAVRVAQGGEREAPASLAQTNRDARVRREAHPAHPHIQSAAEVETAAVFPAENAT